MDRPKTYNEFTSWYYSQKLSDYFAVDQDVVSFMLPALVNGGCVQGDGKGFSLIDSNGTVIRRFNANCLFKGLRNLFLNRTGILVDRADGVRTFVGRPLG